MMALSLPPSRRADGTRRTDRTPAAVRGTATTASAEAAPAAAVRAAGALQLIASIRGSRGAGRRAGRQENGDPDGPGPDTELLRLTLPTHREARFRDVNELVSRSRRADCDRPSRGIVGE
ncbi:hypothetical protein GCM10010222_13430 [Streptomyces tanashiensis]|nr:hypothetical protein GCM10010222_13430 [Streptomyces tanashiensis]